MKFSVLLPTRNRLDLLSYAVDTVKRQGYDNWEIIVSDNCSDDDVEGYVRSLNDDRVKYFRTEKVVPVTDNWNNALEKSSGDYILMLGDDDCLMGGYFATLIALLEEHAFPDLVYTSAFLYAYPGVIPDCPTGFLRSYCNASIFKSRRDPFWLDKSDAEFLVKSSINFRARFDYNMQFSLVSRRLVSEMERFGPFYQSPYPDYYASNALMWVAKRVLLVPLPLVTIGISKKSFGFFYFNDNERTGNAFLQNIPEPEVARDVLPHILPGTDMNSSWLSAMVTLERNFIGSGLRVNWRRYRFLQVCAVFSAMLVRKSDAHASLELLRRRLTLVERVIYDLPLSALIFTCGILPWRYKKWMSNWLIRLTGSHLPHVSDSIDGRFVNILDVFEGVSPRSNNAIREMVFGRKI